MQQVIGGSLDETRGSSDKEFMIALDSDCYDRESHSTYS